MTSFAAMDHCAVLIEDGQIADVFSEKRFEQKHLGKVEAFDVQGAIIAPGFIDTHIHGFGGFGTDDCTTESILKMSRLLCQFGVTSFNPTLYPIAGDGMIDAVRQVAAAIGKESGARIMGLHLEGPFLSPKKLGVQKPDTLRQVDIPFM